jgi:hypothetical protein
VKRSVFKKVEIRWLILFVGVVTSFSPEVYARTVEGLDTAVRQGVCDQRTGNLPRNTACVFLADLLTQERVQVPDPYSRDGGVKVKDRPRDPKILQGCESALRGWGSLGTSNDRIDVTMNQGLMTFKLKVPNSSDFFEYEIKSDATTLECFKTVNGSRNSCDLSNPLVLDRSQVTAVFSAVREQGCSSPQGTRETTSAPPPAPPAAALAPQPPKVPRRAGNAN